MKVQILLLSCLCSSLAITVHYETTGSANNNAKEYKTALKDMRNVQISKDESLGKQIGAKDAGEVKILPRSREDPKARRQSSQIKSREDKKRYSSSIARSGGVQNFQNDPNHQQYMQRMANQLYVAQKHASVLSDYQKFILNQDENVKNFVLAQSIQERTPKPFSRQRQGGRALPAVPKLKYASPEPVAAANADYKNYVVVTPKTQTPGQIISKPQSDHSAQATHIKYVTLAPQSLTHFVESHEPSPKVTLVPYHSPQEYAYYDLAVTQQPQVEAVQIPTTVSLGLGAYESPKYYKSEGGHSEVGLHHEDANYEFMYNVKDHEKHNHFGHKESRTDKTTYGYYFVHLPDGRLETVKYWADKTGYHAKVDYQGEAKHPPHAPNKLNSHNLLHH